MLFYHWLPVGRTVKVQTKVFCVLKKYRRLLFVAIAALLPYQGCSKVEKLGICFAIYNAAVFIVFAVLMLSTTRGKCRIKGPHVIASGTHMAVNCTRLHLMQLLPAILVLLISIPQHTMLLHIHYTHRKL